MTLIFFKKYTFLSVAAAVVLLSCSQAPLTVTKEEAISFAKDIESSIKKRDADFLDNAFDKKEFIYRMHLPVSDEAKGFGDGVVNNMKMGTQMISSLNDDDSYDFIKYYNLNGKHHIIFRVFSNKSKGLNYQDYEIIKKSDKCKIADAYIYTTGETLAETIHNMYTSLYKKSTQDPGGNDKDVAYLKSIGEMRMLVQKGKATEAKQIFNELPPYLKNTKVVLILNLYICSHLSLEDYDTAIKEFMTIFPNEPNMSLLMIDGYYLQKDYPKMLLAVNTLDAQINKDPLLDYHRYLSYNLLGQKDSSMFCLKRLMHNMPDFQQAYLELITIDINEGHNKEADSLIEVYRKKPKFDQKQLGRFAGK